MKQIFRKSSLLILPFFFWFRRRLSIVGINTIASLRKHLGKFQGMWGNWLCRLAWLRHLLQVIVWTRISSDRGWCVAFAGWRTHLSGSINTSCRRELLYGDLRYLEIDSFFSIMQAWDWKSWRTWYTSPPGCASSPFAACFTGIRLAFVYSNLMLRSILLHLFHWCIY